MANVTVPPFTEAPSTVVGSTPQSTFSFEFPFWASADILVYIDGVLLASSAYSVEGFRLQGDPPAAVEGGYGSGEVTLDTAVTNCTVTIDRFVVGDRETQFSKSSPLGMPALNGDLNRVTARQQDLKRLIGTNRAYLDAAIAEAGSAIGLIGKVDKDQNGADYADPDVVVENLGLLRSATGAVSRTVKSKLEDFINLAEFGAVGDDATDNTAAILAAYTAYPGRPLHFGPGTFQVGELGLIGAGGMTIRGERFKTVIKPIASLTNGEAIFYNQGAGTSGSGVIEDVYFDLNGQNCVAIDLTDCNKFDIRRVKVRGADSLATAAGKGVIFGSPVLQSGSYTNSVSDCDFTYLAVGVEFGAGGNSNTIYGGECVGCLVGVDAAPGVSPFVDTPRIYGMRFEGGGIGIKEGAIYGAYFGCRFENNATADIEFTADSDHPQFFGGYTAASAVVLKDLANAESPLILSSDLGRYDVETSASRTKYFHGRLAFAKRTTALNPTLPTTFEPAAYFYDVLGVRNQVGLEWSNAAGNQSVLALTVDAANRTVIRSFDRAAAAERDVLLGGGSAVIPVSTATTDLGSSANRYKSLHLSGTVIISGNQVVGPREAGWAVGTGTANKGPYATYPGQDVSAAYVEAEAQATDDATKANSQRIKAIEDALRTHGLIGA